MPQTTGPAYDIIGDVHACHDELVALLGKLGYAVTATPDGNTFSVPPAGRKAVFVGDLVNRGPKVAAVIRLVMSMVRAGDALCVAGNHDVALAARLQSREAEQVDAIDATLRQMSSESESFHREVTVFLDALPRQLSLDDGRLVVAHAGLPEEYHGADSPEANEFAINGRKVRDARGELVRYDWAADYRGAAAVVYGHYAQPRSAWVNNTLCIDTGCVYGGRLTALRYPEIELVDVPAERVYFEISRSTEFRAAASGAGA